MTDSRFMYIVQDKNFFEWNEFSFTCERIEFHIDFFYLAGKESVV